MRALYSSRLYESFLLLVIGVCRVKVWMELVVRISVICGLLQDEFDDVFSSVLLAFFATRICVCAEFVQHSILAGIVICLMNAISAGEITVKMSNSVESWRWY